MLPGFTSLAGRGDHHSAGGAFHSGAAAPSPQGVKLAGGSGGGDARCPWPCGVFSTACYGFVEFCHCECPDGTRGGDFACGPCFGAWGW